MKERPILFNGDMVRAILSGAKTQTRRPIKPQPPGDDTASARQMLEAGIAVTCPFGQVGDKLWVRETHQYVFDDEGLRSGRAHGIYSETADTDRFDVRYLADPDVEWNWDGGWRPSLHMPRWASRITLEITGVRVERVKEITEDGAINEGITGPHDVGYPAFKIPGDSKPRYSTAVAAFESVWDSIYSAKELGWETNPWVWVIEFKSIRGDR